MDDNFFVQNQNSFETDSAEEEAERERKRIARKRLFWTLFLAVIILATFVIWELVEVISLI